MPDPSLAFLSYTFAGEFMEDFTAAVTEYEQEHIEGPYRASWVFKFKKNVVSEEMLLDWFRNKMMTQVVVQFENVTCWKGFVWSMELEIGNVVLNKDMTDLVNAVAMTYQTGDEIGGDEAYVVFDSAATYGDDIWLTNDESIAWYGRHEEILSSDGTEPEAAERAASILQHKASPFNTDAVFKTGKEPQLRISAVGRMVACSKFFLIEEQLRTIQDHASYEWGMTKRPGTTENWTIADEIKRIVELVEEKTGWLYEEGIAANDTETRMGCTTTKSAFERMVDLTLLRNSLGESYVLRVNDDGGVSYEKVGTQEEYILNNTLEGRVTYPDGTVPTWQARPGLIRVFDEGVGPELPDTWLDDRQLRYAERVVMKEGDEIASFHTRKYDIGDYYRELDLNREFLKE